MRQPVQIWRPPLLVPRTAVGRSRRWARRQLHGGAAAADIPENVLHWMIGLGFCMMPEESKVKAWFNRNGPGSDQIRNG